MDRELSTNVESLLGATTQGGDATVNRQWARGFLLYSSKVHQLGSMINRVRDERKQPQISSDVIFVVMLFGFLFRIQSMEELDREIRKGRLRKLVPQRKRQPSHDTVRRALCQWDLDSVAACHDQFIRKFKHLKGPQRGAIDGWRVAAIDGVEMFTGTGHCCPECLTRYHKDSGTTEYFHRAVFMQKVGGDPRVIYGFEMLKGPDGSEKAEGETTAAKRLIDQVHRHAGRVADVLTLDALYAKATVIHAALDAGQDVVVRLKDERRSIMKDAKGLFDTRPADVSWEERDSKGNVVHAKAWDEADLTSWPQVRVPMRVVKVVRTTERHIRRGAESRVVTDVAERWIATTCAKAAVPARTVARIAAARWDIENMGFHDLKTYWHMDHAFVHHPTAIRAWMGILILAVNLLYTFVYEHLHRFRDGMTPLAEVVQEMKEEVRWTDLQETKSIWETG